MAAPPTTPGKSHGKPSTDSSREDINALYHDQSAPKDYMEAGAPGTPRLARALSRKNSIREEKISIVCSVEGVKGSDHPPKGRQTGYLRLLFPFSSSDAMSLPIVSPSQRNGNETRNSRTPKTPKTPRTPRSLQDATDGHFGRSKHITSFDSRKIVFLCATVSSVGTLVLIYLTLRLRKSMEGEFQ